MKTQTRGQLAEDQACLYLQQQGLQLISKNYHCRHGEIDLIMQDGKQLVFVEVRYRANAAFGGALASVDTRKQSKLIATAQYYLQSKAPRASARFDVVGIDAQNRLQWIPNAFEAG